MLNTNFKNYTLVITYFLITHSIFAQKMLVHKHFSNPIINASPSDKSIPSWRRSHVANASVLAPWQTKDKKWKMYIRGSGNCGKIGCYDQIGIMTQNQANFDPFGSWYEDPRNPILKNGRAGTYDSLHLLDTVVMQAQGETFLFYKSRDTNKKMSYSGAYSTNNGNTFTKFNNNPFSSKGPSDVVFHDGSFYHYYGIYNSNSKKLQMGLTKSYRANDEGTDEGLILPVGKSGSYDDQSVFGGKVFKVPGDKRWFMLYQLSAIHTDFPERFHVAYSYNLKKWTKVNNSLPFMVRGNSGQWDQGGIWTADTFVLNNILYLYYEGWGSFSNDSRKRNIAYYPGGNSRLGAASVSVKDFLDWVKGNSKDNGAKYRVTNVHSGKVLDIAGRKDSDGTNAHQWTNFNLSNQKFEFVKNLDGTFSMTPLHSNKCLTVSGGSRNNFKSVILWKCNQGNSQKWFVKRIGNRQYEIKNKNSGKCLEVIGGKKNNGANIVQYQCTRKNNQRWYLKELNE